MTIVPFLQQKVREPSFQIGELWGKAVDRLAPVIEEIYSPRSIACLAAFCWLPSIEIVARKILWNDLVLQSTLPLPEWLVCLPCIMMSADIVDRNIRVFVRMAILGEDDGLDELVKRCMLLGYMLPNMLLAYQSHKWLEWHLHSFADRR